MPLGANSQLRTPGALLGCLSCLKLLTHFEVIEIMNVLDVATRKLQAIYIVVPVVRLKDLAMNRGLCGLWFNCMVLRIELDVVNLLLKRLNVQGKMVFTAPLTQTCEILAVINSVNCQLAFENLLERQDVLLDFCGRLSTRLCIRLGIIRIQTYTDIVELLERCLIQLSSIRDGTQLKALCSCPVDRQSQMRPKPWLTLALQPKTPCGSFAQDFQELAEVHVFGFESTSCTVPALEIAFSGYLYLSRYHVDSIKT